MQYFCTPSVPTSGFAEAAKKPRRSPESKVTYSSSDSMALTNPVPVSGEDSDSEALLTRPNGKHVIDEGNMLLDEIAKLLEGEEEMCDEGKKKYVMPYQLSSQRLLRKGGMYS